MLFTNAYDVDNFRWGDDHKPFIYKLISTILETEADTNPNRYVSELSKESQEIIVKIGNQLLKT